MKENREFIREIAALALPAGFQSVINLLVTLGDNLMIGSLGEASISAVSICGTYLWLAITFTSGLAGGAVIIAAQDYGSNHFDRIKKLMSLMMVLSFGIGVVFLLITALYPYEILKIYSDVESILEPGAGYLKYIKYSFPVLSLSTAVIIMLRGVRAVQVGLYSTMVSCGINVFLNWVFIFGNLGASAMGASGAALATTISYCVQLAVVLVYLFVYEKNLSFKMRDFNPWVGKELFIKFMHVSLPLLAIDVMYNFSSSAQTMITGRISENYVTANSIVHMGWQIPNVFAQGVALAASVMIGNMIGAKNYEGAKKDSWRFAVLSGLIGLFMAISLQLILPVLIQYYNVTDATRILARDMGYAASVSVFFMAICSILSNGVIKSGGYTNRLLKIDAISIWLIALPLGFAGAFVFGWSAPVLYLVLRSGNIVKSAWSLIQLKKGCWIKDLT